MSQRSKAERSQFLADHILSGGASVCMYLFCLYSSTN